MQFTHETTIVVEAPAGVVREQWTDAESLPSFLSHLRATVEDADDLARLVILLDGRHIEFAAQRTMCSDNTICWQNMGHDFLYVLSVNLQPLAGQRTQVTVSIAYDPPGFLPDIAESFGLSKTFRHALESDMQRYARRLRRELLAELVAGN